VTRDPAHPQIVANESSFDPTRGAVPGPACAAVLWGAWPHASARAPRTEGAQPGHRPVVATGAARPSVRAGTDPHRRPDAPVRFAGRSAPLLHRRTPRRRRDRRLVRAGGTSARGRGVVPDPPVGLRTRIALLDALVGVLRPGGLLVFTTQGESCLAHLDWYGLEFVAAAAEFRRALAQDGVGFVPYRHQRAYGPACSGVRRADDGRALRAPPRSRPLPGARLERAPGRLVVLARRRGGRADGAVPARLTVAVLDALRAVRATRHPRAARTGRATAHRRSPRGSRGGSVPRPGRSRGRSRSRRRRG